MQVLVGQLLVKSSQILFSVTDVKGLLQVMELKLVNSSGTSTTALALCDTARTNPWVSNRLVAELYSICKVPKKIPSRI